MKKEPADSKVKSLLAWAVEYLQQAQIDNPHIDTEYLLGEVLELSRNHLYINPNLVLTEEQRTTYQNLIKKRAQRIPIDYILGYSFFMGLKFKVNTDTLIPRPETEILVEKALEFIKNKTKAKILEIGTGSGNIAVSLAKFSDCRVVSVEKSRSALEIAKSNMCIHGVSQKIDFIHGDIFDNLDSGHKKSFDCLVSNPPYIKRSEYASLQDEVKKEPVSALISDDAGLAHIKRILIGCPQYLKSGSRVFIEIGYDQSEEVESIASNNGFKDVGFVKDYSGIERILTASV